MPMKPAEAPSMSIEQFRDGLKFLFGWARALQREEDERKLQLVCQRYGIPDGPDMFRHLSLCLARDYAPEFKTSKRTGRKPKWSPSLKGALVIQMERTIKADDPTHGAMWAAKQLSKREPWKSLVGEGDDPAEALRRTYYETKDDEIMLFERWYFELCRKNGCLEVWERVCLEAAPQPPRPGAMEDLLAALGVDTGREPSDSLDIDDEVWERLDVELTQEPLDLETALALAKDVK